MMGAPARQFDDIHDNGAARLTPTQLKVLQGVRSGRLNKQIAHDLGIAEATVKAHMTALMRKLKVRNRTQVAVVAQALGYGADAQLRQTRSAWLDSLQ
jgi:DNA-binding NarL/FixJ family response regulator